MFDYVLFISSFSCFVQAACGLTNKPKEIVDIDAGDANNELAAVEYIEDIYKFYKIIEVTSNNKHDFHKALTYTDYNLKNRRN